MNLRARLSFVAAALAVMALAAVMARADEPAPPTRLTLADAVRLAGSAAPAVEMAALRERQAIARRSQARGVLLPSVTGTASDVNRTFSLAAQGITFPRIPGQPAFEDPIGPVESFDARVRVTQPVIDLAGLARYRAADHGAQLALTERLTFAETASQSAAMAYLRAMRAKATLAARETDASIARELLGLAEAQQAAGTAPKIDATRARTEVATARSLQILARNQLDRAVMDLARSLGLDPASTIDLADTLGSQVARSDAPEEAVTAISAAELRRPELAGEREREARARAERSALGLERLPRIEASADWGLSGAHAEDAVSTRQYGVAATMPLLDGLRREGRIAEQTAVLRESEVRERDLHRQIAAEVRAALIDLASSREQQDIAGERLSLAQEELEQARDRFVNGVAGNIEIINAQVSLVRARDADIDARFALASARVALARAAGVARTLR